MNKLEMFKKNYNDRYQYRIINKCSFVVELRTGFLIKIYGAVQYLRD